VRRSAAALVVVAAALALVSGCGRSGGDLDANSPTVGIKGSETRAADALGFPTFATKNTTRVGGADAVADAAAVARAVFPALSPDTRPPAVALLDARDWRVGVAGAVLASAPIGAALLLSDGPELPAASAQALAALAPAGVEGLGGAQVIRVGDVARPPDLRTTDVAADDVFALARSLDAFHAATVGKPSSRVLVVSADDPAFAMPAAAWAAKSGDPVLFTRRDRLPAETRAALKAHGKPRIYVLGPPATIADGVLRELRGLGRVTRIGAPDPVRNAIAFARFRDGSFGWGVTDPGHGLVFVRSDRPLDAVAAAPLSVSGSYGPLLLLDGPDRVSAPLADYLLDIQPGYTSDPVRGVYNHGWVIGDDRTVAVAVQSRIDALLEIRRIDAK
jgi:hypothetical protein